MAAEKSPAFQFYPKDFLADSHVMAMTLQELGAYIRLLCSCWLDRSLPGDVDALARLCRVSPTVFSRLWPALQPCFTVIDGRLTQLRMERERQKQETYRALKVAAGKKGGRPKADGKQRLSRSQANESPPSSSSSSSPIFVSDLPSSKKNGGGGARKERPQFQNQRFAVHRWQVDELISMLGIYAEAFELDEWLMTGAAVRAAQEVAVVPDWWKWLKTETVNEAQRRGLPIAAPDVSLRIGKQTSRLASAMANINREAQK